jgi:beta-lactamase superfamily II metal-dependent hydrolase
LPPARGGTKAGALRQTIYPMKKILLLAACFALVARADQKTKTLDVYWIDSEGGGSTLIVTPAGESVLIDAGNPGGRDPARMVKVAKEAGIERIDYFLLTHYHTDHFGGLPEVAEKIPVGTIYQRAIPAGDPDGRPQSTFPKQIAPFREIAALAPGVAIPLKTAGGTALTLRCLAADQKFVEPTADQARAKNPLPGAAKEIGASDNDNSAAFVLTFGGFKFFDGGDLTWNFEARLVSPYNLVGRVDVYQTDHHGLEVSNNPLLVQSLAPTVSVMNNGAVKGGKPETFAALKSAKSIEASYQLHKSMNVPAADNAPDEFIANLNDVRGADMARCTANLIKMSVAPDGKSYTISIPANGHSRTYQTKM